MTRRTRTSLVAACGLAFAVTAQAQQNTQLKTQTPKPRATENQNAEQQRKGERDQNNRTAARPIGPAGQENNLDAQLAACLIIGNEKEIAVSRMAEQNSQNEQVKKFAQQMVEAHTQMVTQLAQFAEQGGYEAQQLALSAAGAAREDAQPGREPQNNERRSTARREQPPTDGNEATRRSARSEALDDSGRGNDMISIEHEVAQQCLRSIQQHMSEKQGAEFDRAYTGMQVFEHQAMIDKLEVFSRHTSGEFQTALQKGIQTAKEHLQHAKQLHEQIASAGGEQPNSKGRSNPTPNRSQDKNESNKNENK